MSTLIGANIKLARRKSRLSQAELSKLCNWSHYPSRISNYERAIREPKSNDLIKIAKALNVAVDWLYQDHGKGDPMVVYRSLKYVPLLRWQQIAAYLKGEAVVGKDMLPVSNTESNKSFALIVEGDGMESAHGDSFSAGTTIFIDPALEPKHSDYVVAITEGMPTFKQWIVDSGKKMLKPLNPRYPIVEWREGVHMVGVVRMMMKSFR